jgi:protein SCO1
MPMNRLARPRPIKSAARRFLVPLMLACLCLLLAACSMPGLQPRAQGMAVTENEGGTTLNPPKVLRDFTLTSHTGAPFKLADLRGRPALLFFGYTDCPDICPLTLSEWKRIKAALGKSANQIAFVFVSVDGEHDTPEVVARYVAGYDPPFIGLTGEEPTVQAVARDFGAYFHDHGNAEPADLVDHSSYSFLLNREAQLHTVYRYGVPNETITEDIQQLLKQG